MNEYSLYYKIATSKNETFTKYSLQFFSCFRRNKITTFSWQNSPITTGNTNENCRHNEHHQRCSLYHFVYIFSTIYLFWIFLTHFDVQTLSKALERRVTHIYSGMERIENTQIQSQLISSRTEDTSCYTISKWPYKLTCQTPSSITHRHAINYTNTIDAMYGILGYDHWSTVYIVITYIIVNMRNANTR